MSERKEIPYWIDNVYRRHNDKYVNPYGHQVDARFRCENIAQAEYDYINYAPCYCDLDGECLAFNIVKADDDGFYAEEVGRLKFNQYDELEGETGIDMFCPQTGFLNNKAMEVFVMRALCRQPYYEEIREKCELSFSDCHPATLLRMFMENKHKFIPLFLQEGLVSCARNIIKGDSHDYEKVTKKSISIAAKWDINMTTIINLCEKYNPQEIDKFCEMLSFFHYNISDTMDFIANEMEIEDFTGFANYLLKNIILYGRLAAREHYISNACGFLTTYRDYIRMVKDEADCDLYPENLDMAHKAAVDRTCVVEGGEVYNISLFKGATDKYKNLEWDKDGIQIIAPQSPKDLIEESKTMHHCVKHYINDVTKGLTQILLVRKEGRPYMTLEVKKGCLVQARKKWNQIPDSEDAKILNEFAECKNIDIKNY